MPEVCFVLPLTLVDEILLETHPTFSSNSPLLFLFMLLDAPDLKKGGEDEEDLIRRKANGGKEERKWKEAERS